MPYCALPTYNFTVTAAGDETVKLTWKDNDQAAGYQNIAPNTNIDVAYKLSWTWDLETGNDDDAKATNNLYDTILGAIASGEDRTTESGETISVSDSTATVCEIKYTAVTSVALDLKITVEQIQGTDGDSTLAAGLYDKDYNLLAAYATSGMDVTTDYSLSDYQSATASPYYILNNT